MNNLKKYFNLWAFLGVSIFGGVIYLIIFTNLSLIAKLIVGISYLAYHRIGLAIDESVKKIATENYFLLQDVINVISKSSREE